MEFEHTLTATAGPPGAPPAAQAPGELERGATVGRFVLLGTLGAGGMGVVYAAYDPELDRKVALKLLLPRADGTSGTADPTRLMREAQALAKLSHPNVVAVHDVGTRADAHDLGRGAAADLDRGPSRAGRRGARSIHRAYRGSGAPRPQAPITVSMLTPQTLTAARIPGITQRTVPP